MASGINGKTEDKVKTEIKLYCDPELKKLAGLAARKAELPLSDYIVKVLAYKLNRKDLSKIPRKIMGRPLSSSAS